jgi:multimeric flavodoxin WrbA
LPTLRPPPCSITPKFAKRGVAALLPSCDMKTLLIVYHSMTGCTLQMAEAAARGARTEPEMRVSLLRAAAAGPAEVLEASGFIFATPENLAAMSGQMKDFFDRVYYAALDRLNGRPYAAMICAGSDGRNAAQQIDRIATGWRLNAVAPPLIVCTHAQTPEAILRTKIIGSAELQRCEELGATLAAGTALGIF